MKKLLLLFFATVFGLLLVIIAVVAVLLGTESGLSWALRQTDRFAPDLLALESLEGHLLDRLHLRNIQLNLPTARVSIDDFVLDWYPSELLQRKFHLALLKVEAVTIDTVGLAEQPPEPEPEKPGYPIELPDVVLPLTVIIDSVRVDGVEMVNDPNTEPLQIETIALQAQWDDQGLAIQHLGLAMPELEFEADGRVTPVGDYPLEIHTLLRVAQEALPKGRLQGTIAGDKNRIEITQEFDGDVQVGLAAALTRPLQNLGWDGTLDLKEIPGHVISPQFPARLEGQITTRGDLKTARLDGHLLAAGESDPTIDLKSDFALTADLERPSVLIQKLQVVHQTQPMQVSLTGNAALEDKNFALQGDWQDLQWPLAGDPVASSSKGALSAKGTMEDYQFELSAAVSGKDIPTGQWNIEGQGSDQKLNHIEVVGQLLDGVLKTIGVASWAPEVTFDFATTAKHINPGVQYPDWQGEIDMASKVTGKLGEAGPIANVVLSTLTGELRGLPIRGRGAVDVNPEKIDVNDFIIGSGRAEVRANGELGQRSDLRWELDVPEASDLIPEAAGRLIGQGTVRGPQTQPLINAQLEVESFRASQAVVDHLTADLDVDLSYRKKSDIRLLGRGLGAGDQRISEVSVNANGVLDDHELVTSLSHEMGQLRLALQGGLKNEIWKGALQNLSLESGEFGNWQLEKPAELTASAAKASANSLCLTRESARLCAQGKWRKLDDEHQQSSGSFEITAFPLDWVEPWLPETISSIEGEVSAKGGADMGKRLTANADVNITQGKMVLLHPEAGEVSIPHEGMKLVADVKGNGAKADMQFALADNKVTASLDAPDVLAAEDPLKTKINAHIGFDAPNLDPIAALIPQLSTLKGSILLDFDVEGTAGQPNLNGKGKIDLARLDAPEFGITLQDSSIDISANGDALQLEGSLASTEGKLDIKGDSTLSAESGWPTKMSIKGDDFLAVNLPEARVYISPDMFIEKTAQELRLAGNTTVPKAEIFLKSLPPSARSAHPDVVVIQEDDIEQTPQPMPLNMDVTLTLGDEIHFAGFGLDAYFDGELQATAKPGDALSVAGDIRIDQGTFRAYGQDLTIEQGNISFAGGPPSDPGINLTANREIEEVTVGVDAIGPIKKPRVTLHSTPAMSDNDIISYLLTGRPARDLGEGGDKVSVGKQINSKLSASVGTNLDTGEAEFSTRYRLSRKTHLEATTTPKSSAADIFYTWELE